MGMLDTIRVHLVSLEEKDLYRYSAAFLVGTLMLLGFFIFYHYRTTSDLQRRIRRINKLRKEDVQEVLSKHDYVEKQLEDIDTLLSEDKDFKIVAYFREVLDTLKLANKKVIEKTSQIERQDKYRESSLEASFDDMDMKQITELLKALEEKRRIFVKKLDISRSKKRPDKLEVDLVIGTFLLKSE